MKLCSISPIELKKKIVILPNNSKRDKDLIKIEKNINKKDNSKLLKNSSKKDQAEESVIIPQKENIISGLSISSLKIKRSIEKNKKQKKELQVSEQSAELFNEIDLKKEWKAYYTSLLANGSKNLASILQIDQPVIKNKNEIHFTLSNNTNRIELEKNKFGLVEFLRQKLKNNKIELIIKVNKEKEKKFIYSSLEKFEKLKSINPSIDKLRKEFKLGL